jgi:hypothetical protein
MDKVCKNCGSTGLKPKGFVYRPDKTVRYERMRCGSCNAVNYFPSEDREVKSFDLVTQLFAEGRLKIWFDNKVWNVK